MKRFIAMALAMLSLGLAAMGEPENGSEKGASAPTLEQTRYHFEHNALPRYFYDDPANTLETLRRNGVYRLWAALADENGVTYPYHSQDFIEHWYDLDDGTTILQVVMPRPTVTPQCYRLYMVFRPGAGEAHYYTVEYENLLGETALLCGWDAGHRHVSYGPAAVSDPDGTALTEEVRQVAAQAGITLPIRSDEETDRGTGEELIRIECPQQGFAIMADPSCSCDYQEGTGLSVYTEHTGSIPYVIVWRSEDKLAEPFEYIREQFTPYMQRQYGDDLVSCVEYEGCELGGKQLPAGLYTYRLQGHLIDMLRLYDSTGNRTVAYTAKYIQGQGDATLAALETAIRTFEAD